MRYEVLAVAGRIAAGKTTVSSLLSDRLRWPQASFGAFVRAKASEQGIAEDREHLQALGEELIATLGWQDFCQQTLALAGLDQTTVPCVIEGVRHVEAVEALRELFAPSQVGLIYLELDDAQQASRLPGTVAGGRVAAWEKHSTEADVLGPLRDLADLVVASDGQALAKILVWLETST
jgi:dephospho-CoA kinase